MSKNTMTTLINGLMGFGKKHSAEILIAAGLTGMGATVVMGIKATPTALERIKEAEKEKYDAIPEDEDIPSEVELTKVEMVKAAWKCYIPVILTGAASTLCILAANSVHRKRQVALVAAYVLTDSRLKDYREKVVETIGLSKERDIRDEIAKDKVVKNPVTTNEVLITEKGNTLCYDEVSGRYFKSDIETLKRAANELNRRMRDEMYISLNEFYYEIGLGSISIGDDLGWNIDKGYIDLDFSSHLADDGTPCVVLDYLLAPDYSYQR